MSAVNAPRFFQKRLKNPSPCSSEAVTAAAAACRGPCPRTFEGLTRDRERGLLVHHVGRQGKRLDGRPAAAGLGRGQQPRHRLCRLAVDHGAALPAAGAAAGVPACTGGAAAGLLGGRGGGGSGGVGPTASAALAFTGTLPTPVGEFHML
jgi:hypothetical protein